MASEFTLRLTNVPLKEALRYTVSLAQAKYGLDAEGVIVLSLSEKDPLIEIPYLDPFADRE